MSFIAHAVSSLFGGGPGSGNVSSAASSNAAASKAAQAYAVPTLKRAEAGQLSPDEQAAVNQWRQGQSAAWEQYMANSGTSISSTNTDISGQINEQALAMAHGLLTQDIQTSLQALGVSAQSGAALADIGFNQNSSMRNALMGTFAGLGQLWSGAGGIPGFGSSGGTSSPAGGLDLGSSLTTSLGDVPAEVAGSGGLDLGAGGLVAAFGA